MTTISGAGGINANLAPDAFRHWAGHYYMCKQGFLSPDRFSPVPYFLLCRTIELALKAKHLKVLTQDEVKKRFGHNLLNAYKALPAAEQRLDPGELGILRQASGIYSTKGFEYFDPEDALTAYKRYPDLVVLDRIANSLLQ